MANLSILTYSIKELSENPEIVKKFQDPHNYIDNYNAWIKLLKTNPNAKEDDIAIILTIEEQTIIGKLGLYASNVFYNGKKENIYFIAGFFLDDNYKNSGAGGLMLLKALKFSKCLLACGAPRMDTEKLYQGTGFKQLGLLKRFIHFYNTKIIVKKYTKNKIFIPLLSGISYPFLRLYHEIKIKNNSFIFEYNSVQKFSSKLDNIVGNITINHFPRNSKTLNWILNNKNFYAFEIFKNNELIGYCILRLTLRKGDGKHNLPDMNVGVLVDYYLDSKIENAFKDLVLFCTDFFKNKNLDLFEIQCFDEKMEKACETFGLIQLGGNRVFFRPTSTKTFNPDASWFLTYATGDMILRDD